jgi:WD40 repeat protein
VGSKNGLIAIVNLAVDPGAYFTLRGFSSAIIEALAFSPDGSRILVKSSLGGPRVFETQSGRVISNANWGDGLKGTNQFSPDGQRVVSTQGHQVTQVWDSSTGLTLATLDAHPVEGTAFEDGAAPLFGGDRLPYGAFAAFSPDGKRLVTGGNAVRVYYRAFPEGWWGLFYRPELYIALLFGIWSIKRMATRLPEVWARFVNWWEWQGIKVKKRKKKTATV